MSTLHVYVTSNDIATAYSKYLNHRHYIIDRFLIDHHVKVLDVSKCKYYQNKDNRTGDLVMEIELDEKYTEPADTEKLLRALEESRKKATSVPRR